MTYSNNEMKISFVDMLILTAILLIGVWVRVDNLLIWNDWSEAVMSGGQPLLTNFDGYYYIRLARDIIEKSYTHLDIFRAVPDFTSRPFPPPLLSTILAWLVSVTPFSLDWIGVVLPALFGALVALPLFGLGWIFGGRICAYSCALFGTLSHYFVFRTQLGWLDTDCLNVFFPLTITLCFLGFALCNEKRRYLYFCCGLLGYWLFLMWWDQATEVVTLLALFPAIIALVFYYRPTVREWFIFLAVLVLAAFLVFSIIGWDYPVRIFARITSLYGYISKNEAAQFPNIGTTVAEQRPVSFFEAVDLTTDSPVVFMLAVCGVLILIWRQPKKSIFIIPYIVLACGALFFARRFLLFLSPVLALGFGMFMAQVWSMERMRKTARGGVIALLLVLTLGWVHREYSDALLPQMRPELIAGMKNIEKLTPEDAVIWAWWSYGYALNYHGRRATINDGSVHSGERTVYNALPLSASSYRLAANFIQFYSSRGVRGLHQWYRANGNNKASGYSLALEILENGPDSCEATLAVKGDDTISENAGQWCRFFYPAQQKPVYLFINDYLRGHRSWYWQGTWDIGSQKGIMLPVVSQTALEQPDPKKQRIPLNMIRDNLSDMDAEKLFDRSLFSRLYIKKEIPGKYFIPVKISSSPYQIWQVKGDSL